MRTKVLFKRIILLLFISLAINFLCLFDFGSSKSLANSGPQVAKNSKLNVATKSNKTDKSDLMLNNPIDQFLDKHNTVDYSTFSMGQFSDLLMRLWEAELEHAYDVLLQNSHNDIKEQIKKSHDTFIKYASIESELNGAVYASNAFGNEDGSFSENIGYGSGIQIYRLEKKSQLYKSRTIEIMKYLKYLGIEIEFVFNEKKLSKEDKMLFK